MVGQWAGQPRKGSRPRNQDLIPRPCCPLSFAPVISQGHTFEEPIREAGGRCVCCTTWCVAASPVLTIPPIPRLCYWCEWPRHFALLYFDSPSLLLLTYPHGQSLLVATFTLVSLFISHQTIEQHTIPVHNVVFPIVHSLSVF